MGIKVGNEVLAGLGASWGVVPFVFDVGGRGLFLYRARFEKLTFDNNGNPDQLNQHGAGRGGCLGIKAYLAANSFFEIGGRLRRLADSLRHHPRSGFFAGIVFEPAPATGDGDGFKDERRTNAQMISRRLRRLHEDEDGCPDLDNDQDGIPDVLDKCPNDQAA